MNWYAYCGGDPINFVDPTGLFAYGPEGQQYSTYNYINEQSKDGISKGIETANNIQGLIDTGIGIKIGVVDNAIKEATAPIKAEKFNSLNVSEGVVIGYPLPTSEYIKDLNVKNAQLSKASTTVTAVGIGFAIYDSISYGIENGSWEAGVMRGIRNTAVIVGSSLTTSAVMTLTAFTGPVISPLLGASAGYVVGEWIDNKLEKKGW